MHSHIHLLLGFRNVTLLPKVMQAFKSLTTRRVKTLELGDYRESLTQDGTFNLWMRRFDDLIIYTEKQFRIKLDYIHTNPVRAALVAEPCDFEFSSACDWNGVRKGIIPVDKEFGGIYYAED